jgi:broad specificity phosphatase PhoE
MMRVVHFITHPEVTIDPAIPVPEWRLSPLGIARSRAMLDAPWVSGIRAIFSSAERKATDIAGLLGAHLGLTPGIELRLGENDRSATGYLPKPEFERTADAFFANPDQSIRGWERAVDAQARILAAVDAVLAQAPPAGDIALLAHGGVGALLLCHLAGEPISRAADQPGGGGGNRFTFTAESRTLLSRWAPIEAAQQGL